MLGGTARWTMDDGRRADRRVESCPWDSLSAIDWRLDRLGRGARAVSRHRWQNDWVRNSRPAETEVKVRPSAVPFLPPLPAGLVPFAQCL